MLRGMQLVQEVFRRSANNFVLEGLLRLDINGYSLTFFFISIINVIDYCMRLYNFIRSFVALL